MTRSSRNLLGVIGFIVLLVVYPLAVMELYATTMMGLPWWGTIAVLAVLGMLWFVPASWLVRWMAKPD